MATLYIDYEGGNDNYGGSSFALLASAADGALTVGGAFTSASASFPNDGSLINQYLSIFNGTTYVVYRVSAWVSATALTVVTITNGASLAAQSARQYYIGGRWKTITTGALNSRIAAGDTLRLMASPTPTSIGSATWNGGISGQGRPDTIAITSSTNATPIVVTATGHGLVAGDYVIITGHTTNTNANGVWKVGTTASTTFQILNMDGSNTTGNGVGSGGTLNKSNNLIVKLASPVTQNIALCGGLGQKPAWTTADAVNVTCTQNTTAFKEGYSSAQIAIGAGFTTGKTAYYTLPATLNLSTYQQVTFWIQQTAGTIGAAGACYIALCSDTLGATVVNTINIPALGVLSAWQPVTVDLAANLGASIRSVAFYVVTDNAAQTFLIDNIVACKASSSADSLSLVSLVSKSTGVTVDSYPDESWYALQSINYDAVMLANENSQISTNPNIRGYSGTSEAVTTYKRETIKTPQVAQVAQRAGSAGSLISYSGGWDRTNMSTQTGTTWFDGVAGTLVGISTSTTTYVYFTETATCRYSSGFTFTNGSFCSVGDIYATACGSVGVGIGPRFQGTRIFANNNALGLDSGSAVSGASLSSVFASNCSIGLRNYLGPNTYTTVVVSNTNSAGLQLVAGATNTVFTSLTANGGSTGILVAAGCFNNYVNSGSATNLSATLSISAGANMYFNDFVFGSTTEVSGLAVGGTFVYSNRHDNTDGNNWVFQGTGTVNQQSSVVDSPATTSWKMNPTTTSASALIPLKLKLGTVVCGASTLVTVTARMRRDNTGLTMRLVCPGGQINGVASDVTADMTAAANTWETVTITFTPTKAGAVDIWAYAFGGTSYSGYVCNLTASQA